MAGSLYGLYHYGTVVEAETEWKKSSISFTHNSVNDSQTENLFKEYEKILPLLKRNPQFLYNYAALLNKYNFFTASLRLTKACEQIRSDYDLRLLKGDNLVHLRQYQEAVTCFRDCAYMVPSRFMPLYKLLEIYIETGLDRLAGEMAVRILEKEVKVPSLVTFSIKSKAKNYLTDQKNEP